MATASKSASTEDKAADAAASKSGEGEEPEPAPAPPPVEPAVDRSAAGTTVGIVSVRSTDVDVPDYYVDPKARKDDEGKVPDDDAPKGTQVDVFQVSVSGSGVLLLMNDQALLLDGTQTFELKKALDAAVMAGVH